MVFGSVFFFFFPCTRKCETGWGVGVGEGGNTVSMVLNVHRNLTAYQGRRWGEREIICLSLRCHHQNDSCIKMGSDESHFNVSLIVRDKVTRQCPQTTICEEK